MRKTTELTAEPEVGKFYLVPCVNVDGDWFPVVGETHADVELGISNKHLHHDVRFLPDKLLHDPVYVSPEFIFSAEEASMVLITYSPRIIKNIVWRKMKCRRRMPNFKFVQRKDYLDMHKKYLGREIKCGRCPHRNMPLESLPQDANGHVICNGHGLKIDMKAGRVIKREA